MERMCHVPDMDYHNCVDSSDCHYWGEDESGNGSDYECYFGEEDEETITDKEKNHGKKR
jgi:hypothetical protein